MEGDEPPPPQGDPPEQPPAFLSIFDSPRAIHQPITPGSIGHGEKRTSDSAGNVGVRPEKELRTSRSEDVTTERSLMTSHERSWPTNQFMHRAYIPAQQPSTVEDSVQTMLVALQGVTRSHEAIERSQEAFHRRRDAVETTLMAMLADQKEQFAAANRAHQGEIASLKQQLDVERENGALKLENATLKLENATLRMQLAQQSMATKGSKRQPTAADPVDISNNPDSDSHGLPGLPGQDDNEQAKHLQPAVWSKRQAADPVDISNNPDSDSHGLPGLPGQDDNEQAKHQQPVVWSKRQAADPVDISSNSDSDSHDLPGLPGQDDNEQAEHQQPAVSSSWRFESSDSQLASDISIPSSIQRSRDAQALKYQRDMAIEEGRIISYETFPNDNKKIDDFVAEMRRRKKTNSVLVVELFLVVNMFRDEMFASSPAKDPLTTKPVIDGKEAISLFSLLSICPGNQPKHTFRFGDWASYKDISSYGDDELVQFILERLQEDAPTEFYIQTVPSTLEIFVRQDAAEEPDRSRQKFQSYIAQNDMLLNHEDQNHTAVNSFAVDAQDEHTKILFLYKPIPAHWVLVMLVRDSSRKIGKIFAYDPMEASCKAQMDLDLPYLAQIASQAPSSSFRGVSWDNKVTCLDKFPRQTNSLDCCFYALSAARHIVHDKQWHGGPNMSSHVRRDCLKDIIYHLYGVTELKRRNKGNFDLGKDRITREDMDRTSNLGHLLVDNVHGQGARLSTLVATFEMVMPRVVSNISKEERRGMIAGVLDMLPDQLRMASVQRHHERHPQAEYSDDQTVWERVPGYGRTFTSTEFKDLHEVISSPAMTPPWELLDDDINKKPDIIIAWARTSAARNEAENETLRNSLKTFVPAWHTRFSADPKLPTFKDAKDTEAIVEFIQSNEGLCCWTSFLVGGIGSRERYFEKKTGDPAKENRLIWNLLTALNTAAEDRRLSIIFLACGHDGLITNYWTFYDLCKNFPNLDISLTLATKEVCNIDDCDGRKDGVLQIRWHHYEAADMLKLCDKTINNEQQLHICPRSKLEERFIHALDLTNAADWHVDLRNLLKENLSEPEESTICDDCTATGLLSTEGATALRDGIPSMLSLWHFAHHAKHLYNMSIINIRKTMYSMVVRYKLGGFQILTDMNKIAAMLTTAGDRTINLPVTSARTCRRCDRQGTWLKRSGPLAVDLVCQDHEACASAESRKAVTATPVMSKTPKTQFLQTMPMSAQQAATHVAGVAQSVATPRSAPASKASKAATKLNTPVQHLDYGTHGPQTNWSLYTSQKRGKRTTVCTIDDCGKNGGITIVGAGNFTQHRQAYHVKESGFDVGPEHHQYVCPNPSCQKRFQYPWQLSEHQNKYRKVIADHERRNK